jgi:photosystem II stability/assembly factor-like uncharacterized protein
LLRTLLAALAVAAAAAGGTQSRTLEQVAFSDPQHGYGLVVTQSGSRCSDVVERTIDGGAHFTHPVTVGPCAQASSIAFDANGDGFLYDPGLFATHDGGATWSRLRQPGAVLEVSIEDRSVWLAERVCRPACRLALYVSAGGRRATVQPRGLAAPPRAVEEAAGQDYIVRTGPSSGYVLSRPTTAGVTLDHTSDGGRTWTRREIPCSGFSAVLTAGPDGSLFALCAREPGAGTALKSSASSRDGGRSWTVHAPCANPNACHSPLADGYLGTLATSSPGTAFALGERSPPLVTHDDGASWRALWSVGDVNGEPAQVLFLNSRAGIVLGRANGDATQVTIWHTSDAGAVWTALRPSI